MILALVMALALVACGNKNTDDGKKDNPDDNKTPTVITNPDKVQDEMTSSDGKYEVAFVTDVGKLKDKSFNQGTYDGVKDRKSTRLNSSHNRESRMPSSA